MINKNEILRGYTARIIWRKFRSEGVIQYKLLRIVEHEINFLKEENNTVYYLKCDRHMSNLFLRVSHDNNFFNKIKYTIEFRHFEDEEWRLYERFIEPIHTEDLKLIHSHRNK